MFGRYLITTMILVALSTVISVVTVNFRFRSGNHKMSPWIRTIFLKCLPKLLCMNRPEKPPSEDEHSTTLVDATSLIAVPALAYPLPNSEIKKEREKYAGEKLKNNKMAMTDLYPAGSKSQGSRRPPRYEESGTRPPFVLENTVSKKRQ